MRILHIMRAVAACSSFAFPALFAQSPPAASVVGMHTTDRYLFVVRGDTLYQFDVHTLALRGRFQFPSSDVAVELPTREVPVVVTAPPPSAASLAKLPEPPAPEAVAAAVEAGIAWLARHQDEDGKWDADQFMKHDDPAHGERCDGAGPPVHDVTATGLALLALLGDGSTLRSGPHKESVKKAVKWLKEQQDEKTGMFGVPAAHDFVYGHAIATYAICEAFGLSHAQLLKPTAQNGIDYLESHRNPYAVWRYQPRDNDNDTSVTAWATLAYESAVFFGLQVNREALKFAATWFDQVSTPDGRAGYTRQGESVARPPAGRPNHFLVGEGEAITAAATFTRLMLGQKADEQPILQQAAKVLAADPPRWRKGRIDATYWFFGTSAAHELGGETWDVWHRTLADLVAAQCKDGNKAGSWDPVGASTADGGRVAATALYTLALEVPKRRARTK